jgi:hypothetical protein
MLFGVREMLAVVVVMLALALAVACGGARVAGETRGGIHGVARDQDTGTPIAHAAIHLRAAGQLAATSTTSGANGSFTFLHLAPGVYSINAEFAGQPVDIEGIEVNAGATVPIDLTFTLGRPDPIHLDFGDPKSGAIARYRPPGLASTKATIEGTVRDAATRGGVVGAVVTVVGSSGTLPTVTDDDGRYRLTSVEPGTYVVSAYYSISGRGQIEVRRSDIHVAGGEAVVVPLWIELAGQ